VNPYNFFAELRRRDVYNVAIATQSSLGPEGRDGDASFPFLENPNWTIRLVIMLIAIGFPIAL
jgi:hypothetical protein